ncbi:MAG: creatininase family protein [Alsobacter sp.]
MSLPRYWTELQRHHLESGALAQAVAVLPVAAVEQHGPHLPLGVDVQIMEHALAAVLRSLPETVPAVMLPIQAVGVSPEHSAFTGTLTVPAILSAQVWTAIAEGVAATGCRRLVLLSSHGGNMATLEIVAQNLRARLGLVCVTTSFARFGLPPGLTDAGHDWHGGLAETAVMLAARPDLVVMQKARNFESRGEAMERDFARLRASRPAGLAWMAQDLHPEGAIGDASRATAALGEAIVAHQAAAVAELLADVARFTL